MALYLELNVGDSMKIGEGTTITLDTKSGKVARLRVDSKEDVRTVKATDAHKSSIPLFTRTGHSPTGK